MSDSFVLTQVSFEISQLDQLFAVYADLIRRATQQTPDLVEITALAAVLHSFYNGLENVFLSIARHYDQQVPTGDRWHRALLVQMAHPTQARASVLSVELVRTLTEYQGFRHFYRHSYSLLSQLGQTEATGDEYSPNLACGTRRTGSVSEGHRSIMTTLHFAIFH